MIENIAKVSKKLEEQNDRMREGVGDQFEANGQPSGQRFKELDVPKWGKSQCYKQWKAEYEEYKRITLDGVDGESNNGQLAHSRVRLKLLEMLNSVVMVNVLSRNMSCRF